MIQHSTAFDVQLALARVTRLRVDTRQLDQGEVQFQIGFKWTLTLDEHQLDRLHDNLDSDAAFRDALDGLKPGCLRYNSFLASR